MKDILFTPITQDFFMDAFIDNFFIAYVKEKKKEEFQDLCQGNRSINQYATSFIQLSYFSGTESRKARKFLKGIRADIFDGITILKLSSYTEALEYAQVAKDLISARHQCFTHIHAQQQQKRRISYSSSSSIAKRPYVKPIVGLPLHPSNPCHLPRHVDTMGETMVTDPVVA